jgi:glutamate synthase (NADPH/NADH) small chain
MEDRAPKTRRPERVAIIGSGPAGLSAADYLNKAGFSVIVFDRAAHPGGILRYGIPSFKLEKSIVDRRIKLMESEGVRFENGVDVGVDLSYHYLRDRFDAVCLCGGAREPRDLPVPGRDLEGIHFAMPFLMAQNRRDMEEPVPPEQDISARNRTVVVIGGGDTGSDCLGTSLRQGANKVYQLEIMPKPPTERADDNPWPLWPRVYRESSSHKEGGDRRWCVNTKEFVGKDGKLTGLKCVEVEWQQGENGRMRPVEKPGTEFDLEADLVLLSMGFTGPGRNRMVEDLNIEKDERGNIRINEQNMTSEEGVFAAGDMSSGQSLVVRAMADGLQAAHGIMAYLEERNA